MDIDNFKPINDRFGHNCGDIALVDIVTKIKRCLRSQDLLARWGGDEFVLILPQTEAKQAWELTAKIRNSIADLEPIEDFFSP